MYYTYILYSAVFKIYYKGITENPDQRLWEHNNNKSRFTSGKGPWELVYLKGFPSKREALIGERRLKSLNRRSIELLVNG
ncbi:predicted endonuclease, GIY-YIG superfamily [Lentimicrobium saccharophilum]|uniref:Predicted endonuclease, GIY-YIG superfamily n=1 Tax=Lentimicrobium saccharophilum TaxID=1678841 RepID=A0A0S7BW15_9BACT|nr:predicted endonuclease, GIY-YIG superfamily [Lentimicrobium saccharophilum]